MLNLLGKQNNIKDSRILGDNKLDFGLFRANAIISCSLSIFYYYVFTLLSHSNIYCLINDNHPALASYRNLHWACLIGVTVYSTTITASSSIPARCCSKARCALDGVNLRQQQKQQQQQWSFYRDDIYRKYVLFF
jgi:hypothetical protein